jgi:hypothetical protein
LLPLTEELLFRFFCSRFLSNGAVASASSLPLPLLLRFLGLQSSEDARTLCATLDLRLIEDNTGPCVLGASASVCSSANSCFGWNCGRMRGSECSCRETSKRYAMC